MKISTNIWLLILFLYYSSYTSTTCMILQKNSKSALADDVSTVDDNDKIYDIDKNDPDYEDFQAFKKKNNRHYKSKKSEQKRFARFKKRKERILKLNKNNEFYKVKVNRFADVNATEFSKTFLTGVIPDLNKIPHHVVKPAESVNKTFLQMRTTESLTPIDWSALQEVSQIENQEDCGACWAFATAGMLESFYSIQNKKGLVKFSRQQLLDCLSETIGFPGSCQGGSHVYALYYTYLSFGVLEQYYPWTGVQGNCRAVPGNPEYNNKIDPVFKEFNVSPSVTPDQLYDILAQGPVAVNIDASSESFIYYESGVLKYDCLQPSPNHIVLLVGYGVDSLTNEEYWVIKNSWGADWGIEGYGRILKSDNWNGCYIYTNVVAIG